MPRQENTTILRQAFNKLWQNNIFLPEQQEQRLTFLPFVLGHGVLRRFLHKKFTSLVSWRTNKLDFYNNLYKYRKNEKVRRRRNKRPRLVIVTRLRPFKFTLPGRFEKTLFYQILLQPLMDRVFSFRQFLLRLREPIRRLWVMRVSQVINCMRKVIDRLRRYKYFRNSVATIILLHYYKASDFFAKHFSREFQRVRKKQQWPTFYAFKKLLYTIPLHRQIGRHFYGFLLQMAGRPKARNRTIVCRMKQGYVVSQTYSIRLASGIGEAFSKVGVFGIKTLVAY